MITSIYFGTLKTSSQNITLQQHCIRRKDATQNLETTKDQLTSSLAISRRLHMTIKTSSLSSPFSAASSISCLQRTVWIRLPLMEHATCYKVCIKMDSNEMGCP